MKMRYVHEGGSGFIRLWTETDSEARMLAALEPMDHALEVSVKVERSDLRPRKLIDPEPLG